MRETQFNWASYDENDLAQLSAPDPEFQEFIAANPLPAGIDFSKNLPAIRIATEGFNQAALDTLDAASSKIAEFKRKVPLRDGQETSVSITRPASSSQAISGRPLIVLFHGGGWVIGKEGQMVSYARRLTLLFNAVVVCATYRLAPEHPFPTGPLDAYDALQWAASNSKELGADPAQGFILGGASAGGSITCALTQLARERGLSPPLTGQWCAMPGGEPQGDLRKKFFSREQNADAVYFSTNDLNICDSHYAPDKLSPLYSPLNSEKGLAGTPKSYVQVCGADPLRDDGLILAKCLMDVGVETRVDIYPGLPHGFWYLNPHLDSTKKFMVDLAGGFAWLLDISIECNRVEDVWFLANS